MLTEGILTRMIQDDPGLEGVAAIVFDEFHERHLSGDLGLALALDVQAQLRPDLRLIVMSATLDGEALAALDRRAAAELGRTQLSGHRRAFSGAARRSAGVPVAPLRGAGAGRSIRGDLLVFLPGQREIAEAQQALAALPQAAPASCTILPLHGELPIEQQTRGAVARSARPAPRSCWPPTSPNRA